MNFTSEQIERYSRHIILPEVGGRGQGRLLGARVLLVGMGGLGAPAALYLAAAGVGTLGLIDGDEVDRTNLQRQVIHFTPDVGRKKVESAAEKIEALNPDVSVEMHPLRLTAANARAIVRRYDFVLDGTDNLAAKFLVNDACWLEKVPFSHAGILRFDGQLLTVIPGEGPCFRCIFPAPPPPGAVPSCSQAGVLGVLAGVIGTLQAVEALKYLLGIGEPLSGRLLVFDARKLRFREVPIRRSPRCPLCGEQPSITNVHEEEQPACDLMTSR